MIPASTALPRAASDAKRLAFVEAAERAFFDNGYAGTTMSSIAAIVGGSKTTLWSYFPSKQALFEAVMDRLAERYGQALSSPLDVDQPLEDTLRRMGTAMMAALLSDPVIAMHRLVTGEAGRFPELARIVHDRGATRGHARLVTYFRAAMRRGAMQAGDANQAASHFAALCQGGVYQRVLLGLTAKPGARQVNMEIEGAIATFLARWG